MQGMAAAVMQAESLSQQVALGTEMAAGSQDAADEAVSCPHHAQMSGKSGHAPTCGVCCVVVGLPNAWPMWQAPLETPAKWSQGCCPTLGSFTPDSLERPPRSRTV